MGVRFVPQNFTANNAILSYTQDENANTSRSTLGLCENTPDQFGIWNSTDTWLMVDGQRDAVPRRRIPSQPYPGHYSEPQDLSQRRRDDRHPLVQKPYIGAEDLSPAERATGSINYVYLRNGELSANWIAA
ncbi:hypothetical protein [Ensifer sp. 1H6]|uniref:hypothetical protein n=1 Tax=Ensifer sp. 1H6 TaxID=1911585 RepID=UPI000FE1C71D|nr:hypothetical protein [Ensifer sp. 1H6]